MFAFTNKGVVRQTARWVAKGFDANRNAHPTLNDTEIAEYMIKTRYSVGVNPVADEVLRNAVLSDFRARPSLNTLLVSILTNERVLEPDDVERKAYALSYLRKVARRHGVEPRLDSWADPGRAGGEVAAGAKSEKKEAATKEVEEEETFEDYFLQALSRPSQELFDRACNWVSYAFGNDPARASEDDEYRRFIKNYVENILAEYVEEVGIANLALAVVWSSSLASVLASIQQNLAQVQERVLPDPEVAETILGRDEPSRCLSLAVVELAAIACRTNKKYAKVLGAREKLLGGWVLDSRR